MDRPSNVLYRSWATPETYAPEAYSSPFAGGLQSLDAPGSRAGSPDQEYQEHGPASWLSSPFSEG